MQSSEHSSLSTALVIACDSNSFRARADIPNQRGNVCLGYIAADAGAEKVQFVMQCASVVVQSKCSIIKKTQCMCLRFHRNHD